MHHAKKKIKRFSLVTILFDYIQRIIWIELDIKIHKARGMIVQMTPQISLYIYILRKMSVHQMDPYTVLIYTGISMDP